MDNDSLKLKNPTSSKKCKVSKPKGLKKERLPEEKKNRVVKPMNKERNHLKSISRSCQG